MPLLGPAAMLLSFDVDADAVDEHDRWHSLEHLPERLSIPGFLRGTRWVAVRGEPRYLVLYEVASLDVLTGQAYQARLNDPTPWTRKLMPHYRGMRRGLCNVVASTGCALGGVVSLLRSPQLGRSHVVDAVDRPGVTSAHLLHGAASAVMTNEQRIRGADAAIDAALVVTGWDETAVAAAIDGAAVYRLACLLDAR